MRQASSLILILLFVLVGVGFFLFGGSSSSTAPTTGIGPSAGPRAAGAAGRAAPELVAESGTETPERVEVAPGASPMSLEANQPLAGAEATTGPAVRGRIVDTAGNPLEGALVVVAGGDPLPIDYAGNSNSGFAQRWRTTSGTDGRFVLQGPEPGALRIGVWLEGYAPLERTNLVLPAGTGADFGDFALDLGVVLEGRVVVAGGGPVAGAELIAMPVGDSNPFAFMMTSLPRAPLATTGSDGRFRIDKLSAGPWKLAVKSAGHPDKTFEGRTERPGDASRGLEFALEPGARIAGRVVGFPEGGLEDLVVRATPKGQGRSFGPSRSWREAPLESDGSFVLEGCSKDVEYELQARVPDTSLSAPWRGVVKTRTGVLAARGGQSGLVLEWTGTTGVRLRVVDATGAPVEQFVVHYGAGFMRQLEDDGEPRRLHAGGKVLLEELTTGRRSRAFRVRIEAAGFEGLEREVKLEAGRVVDAGILRLASAPVLTVRVTDAHSGLPLTGAEVKLSVGDVGEGPDATGQMRLTKTDADGIARLSTYPASVGQLRVAEEQHTSMTFESFAMAASESMQLDVALGVGGVVAVTVLDAYGNPLPGAKVERRLAGEKTDRSRRGRRRSARLFGGTPEGMTDQDGVAQFEHLQPGEHEFKLGVTPAGGIAVIFLREQQEDTDGWLSVQVSEGSYDELELREEPRASLVGLVRESGQALVGAKLELVAKQRDNPLRSPRMSIFGGMGGPGAGKSDGRGAFTLEGVEPGAYTLTVDHPTRAMSHQVDVELSAGENRMDLDLPVAIVEGHVIDGDGRPLAGVKVEVKSLAPPRFGGMVFFESDSGDVEKVGGNDVDPSTTDATGRYRLRGVASGEELRVSASMPGMVPAESEPFVVSDGQLRSGIDLTLVPAGSLQVTTTGAEDQDMAIITATYLDEEGVEPVTRFARGGEALLDGLRPGSWEVSIERLRAEADSEQLESQTVEIQSGVTAELSFAF